MDNKHKVVDTDLHFKIDGRTRTVTNVSQVKTVLMQGDRNSERLTFEIPRYIDSHDMTLCDVCQIHYININSSTQETNAGIYEVYDLRVSPDDENVALLSWLITGNVTKYVGSLNFVIRFSCTENGEIQYVWNTAIYKNIKVSSTVNNAEVILNEYPDILEQWREQLFSTYESIIRIELKADSWIESNDKTHYTQEVVIPEIITATTKVDLQPNPEQLVSLITNGISMFAANDDRTITVYSVNDKPVSDMTMQATIKETSL